MMDEKNKSIACIAFSEQGYELARRIAASFNGTAVRSGRPLNVHEWTREHFSKADALVYVGAVGIAVRSIASLIEDKASDPAVVVIDERALHVIPILSGHLGGANDLAREISLLTGSDCVITTATDVNGVFAVDEWSKRQDCVLLEKDKIMNISGTLLAGGRITVYSPWPIAGDVPEGIDVLPPDTDPYEGEWAEEMDISLDIEVIKRKPLHLIPKICVLGIGCRKGTPPEDIEEMFYEILEMTGVHPAAICAAASIDLKEDEPGLVSFCREHGWPLLTYSSEQLQAVEGDFTPSAFVASITGVDNVCERSAVLASGGQLIQNKLAGGGVTMAMAVKPYAPDWTWRGEGMTDE